jgi:SHS family lactate transporter-like MFS transporter
VSVSSNAAVKVKTTSDHRAALIAAYLGWTLDAFDYFLLVFCFTAIGREFHRSDAEMAFSLTITLALRPLGAFLWDFSPTDTVGKDR